MDIEPNTSIETVTPVTLDTRFENAIPTTLTTQQAKEIVNDPNWDLTGWDKPEIFDKGNHPRGGPQADGGQLLWYSSIDQSPATPLRLQEIRTFWSNHVLGGKIRIPLQIVLCCFKACFARFF